MEALRLLPPLVSIGRGRSTSRSCLNLLTVRETPGLEVAGAGAAGCNRVVDVSFGLGTAIFARLARQAGFLV